MAGARLCFDVCRCPQIYSCKYVRMYVYSCCTHVCMHGCRYLRTNACLCMYARRYVSVRVYLFTAVCQCVRVYVDSACAGAYVFISECVYQCMQKCGCVRMCVCGFMFARFHR